MAGNILDDLSTCDLLIFTKQAQASQEEIILYNTSNNKIARIFNNITFIRTSFKFIFPFIFHRNNLYN